MALFIRSSQIGKKGFSCSKNMCRTLTVRGVTMPETDFKPNKYQGIPYEEAMHLAKTRIFPTFIDKQIYFKKPLFLHQGYMQWLYDTDGKRYLDLFAAIATTGIGHCHPKITKAIVEQSQSLVHCSNLYLHPKQVEYAEKLIEKMPGDLKVCFFTNSGSEANDLAIAMMRTYTGAWDIISHRNGYHGVSPSTLGLTNVGQYKFGYPNGFGTHSTTNPDVYKGKWGGKNCRDSPVQTDRSCDCVEGECQACDHYIDQLQDLLDNSLPARVAGYFAEPTQGVGGVVQYPKEYLKKAYERIRGRGGLVVADEVQTGFGRLGSHFWGFEASGVMPDIVTCAKTIANGLPFAAVITTPEIAASMSQALPFNTYSGNPVACAAACAVLDVIAEDKTQELCAEIGTYCLQELSKMRDEYSIIGDVRGKGLLIGIEFVVDKQRNKPLELERLLDILERCKDYRVIFGRGGRFGNVFRIKPPMCVTKEDIDYGLAVLRQAIEENMLTYEKL